MTKKIIVLQAISVYNGKRSCRCGGMADTLDSGSSEGNFMQVQVLSPAPKKKGFPIGNHFFFGAGVGGQRSGVRDLCLRHVERGSRHVERKFGVAFLR